MLGLNNHGKHGASVVRNFHIIGTLCRVTWHIADSTGSSADTASFVRDWKSWPKDCPLVQFFNDSLTELALLKPTLYKNKEMILSAQWIEESYGVPFIPSWNRWYIYLFQEGHFLNAELEVQQIWEIGMSDQVTQMWHCSIRMMPVSVALGFQNTQEWHTALLSSSSCWKWYYFLPLFHSQYPYSHPQSPATNNY